MAAQTYLGGPRCMQNAQMTFKSCTCASAHRLILTRFCAQNPRDPDGKPLEPPTPEALHASALAAEQAVKALIETKNQGYVAAANAMKATLVGAR